MEAGPNDIKKAYAKLGGLLAMMKEVVEREKVELAGRDIRKAEEVFAMAEVDQDPYSSVKFLDQTLSYIHHAINDLLQEKNAKLHSPADYERHYDVILPFKEEW